MSLRVIPASELGLALTFDNKYIYTAVRLQKLRVAEVFCKNNFVLTYSKSKVMLFSFTRAGHNLVFLGITSQFKLLTLDTFV